jgi:hypothetical protein
MLRVNFLIRHANPLDRDRAAARDAAKHEAAFQLDQLESINLELETPEYRVRVMQWCRELRQIIGTSRRKVC